MIPMSKIRDAAWMIGCVAVMAVVLAVVLGISRLNTLAEGNRKLGEANVAQAADIKSLLHAVASQQDQLTAVADQIKSCTDSEPPVGDCYAEGIKRQTDTVAGLNEITFYSVACSPLLDGSETPEQAYRVISACVADLRERLTGGKP